jgi:hypothetical protein
MLNLLIRKFLDYRREIFSFILQKRSLSINTHYNKCIVFNKLISRNDWSKHVDSNT